MAAGDGFYANVEWEAQQQQFDVFKVGGLMHACIVEKAPNTGLYTVVAVVLPNSKEVYRSDLAQHGMVHIFGVVAEPSRDTNTWKLVCVTHPPGKGWSGWRKLWFEDTGIVVDWAQVAG